MAEQVIEIELAAPAGSGEWQEPDVPSNESKEQRQPEQRENPGKRALEIALVGAFDEAARKRNAFALSEKHRTLRVERFEQALKAIAKRMSSEAANRVSDRKARSEVRIQIYRGLMLLLNELGKRQETSAASARRALKWSIGMVATCLVGTGLTLFATGLLPFSF